MKRRNPKHQTPNAPGSHVSFATRVNASLFFFRPNRKIFFSRDFESRLAWNLKLGISLVLGVWSLEFSSALADDWPQWRGPNRNGISGETNLNWQWPKDGPKVLWRATVGAGHSQIAVVGNRTFTLGNKSNEDTVYCLDASTSVIIWKHTYPCLAGQYAGPRATPTVEGNRVFTLSRDGRAFCFDSVTGAIAWEHKFTAESGAIIPKWGFAGSPLIVGDLVLYNVASAGAALDKKTGKHVWRSPSGIASYASPVAFPLEKQQLVAIFPSSGLVAVHPVDGRKLWEVPWSWNDPYQVNVADPIFVDDTVFISSDYKRGSALLKISSAEKPTALYERRTMQNHINTCILLDGYLYGNDIGRLTCIELKTGNVQWQQRGFGKGGLILASGKLIALAEDGHLVIAEASPQNYKEIARAKILDGTCYTPPSLANGRLYLRNNNGDIVCLDLKQ